MDSAIPIKFEVEALLRRTAVRAVEAELTATHGQFFARAFLEDHSTAIERLVRRLLLGRSVAQVALYLHTLNRRPWCP